MSTPTMAKVKIHTGPLRSVQNHVSLAIVQAGYAVTCVGTEHLYADLPLSDDGWGIIPAMSEIERIAFNNDGRFLHAIVLP